jgi:hypothetical protein
MNFQSGFQSGLSMGKEFKSGQTDRVIQDAMMRIKNGEDAQTVIKSVAQSDPQAAMKLQQMLQGGMNG